MPASVVRPAPVIQNGPNPPGGVNDPSGDLIDLPLGGQLARPSIRENPKSDANVRFYPLASNPHALGTVNVDGPTDIAGTMNVDANLTLGSVSGRYSTLNITNGGHLTLGGDATGGTIAITAGTLEFSQIGFTHGPETESLGFSDKLSFTGKSGAVQFDGSIGPLTLGINIPLQEIAVFNLGEKIADFHLAPPASQTPYSAANFSVKGNELLYHHS